jgi:hypothetical protein
MDMDIGMDMDMGLDMGVDMDLDMYMHMDISRAGPSGRLCKGHRESCRSTGTSCPAENRGKRRAQWYPGALPGRMRTVGSGPGRAMAMGWQ